MRGASERWKRLVPAIKIAVAAGLIAFLLWLVPIRDHLYLPDPDGGDPRDHVGKILERTDEAARFLDLDNGAEILLELDGDLVVRATFPDGVVAEPEPGGSEGPHARLEAGILTILKGMSFGHMAAALLLLFLGSMIAVYRWHLLLRAVDLGIPFSRTFSLTYIGTFFNNVMPGLTGGDLVKAFYIAKDHPRRKTEAIITVLLDRVLGLSGLALVAACVIPLDLERYGEVAPWIYGILAAEVLFGCVFFSRRIRRLIRLDHLLEKLPFRELVAKIDRAVFMYRYRRRMLVLSIFLSMAVHLVIISAIGTIGVGLGLTLEFLSYFAIVPIGLIASALPIAPSGLGVAEATLVYFLASVGVSKARALSLSGLYRIAQLAISLIGGVCLARLKGRVSAEEMERFAESEDDPGDRSDISGGATDPEPTVTGDSGDTAPSPGS